MLCARRHSSPTSTAVTRRLPGHPSAARRPPGHPSAAGAPASDRGSHAASLLKPMKVSLVQSGLTLSRFLAASGLTGTVLMGFRASRSSEPRLWR
jgi:hypothetical protein